MSVQSKERFMELKFNLPDYCEGCKLMELIVQQPEYVGIIGTDRCLLCTRNSVRSMESLLDEKNKLG